MNLFLRFGKFSGELLKVNATLVILNTFLSQDYVSHTRISRVIELTVAWFSRISIFIIVKKIEICHVDSKK